MENSDWTQLAESMREATLDGRSWHAVARNLSTVFDSPAVALYGQSTDAGSFKETAVLGITDLYVDAYKNHYSRCDNPWISASRFWRPGAIRTERTLQQLTGDRKILRNSGYFQDWIQPQGYCYSMGMVVDHDDHGYVKLTMYRGRDAGAYDRLELERFKSICQQFRMLLHVGGRYQQAKTLARLSLRALDHLAFGIVLLSGQGEVLELNRYARRLFDDRIGLTLAPGGIKAQAPHANLQLQRLLSKRLPGTATSVDLSPPEVRLPLTISVVDADPVFADAGTLLFITCPGKAFDLHLAEVTEQFALTPVELELTRGLLQGLDLRSAGRAIGLSYETSRWYLKQLFSKTGTHRQAELIRVLLSARIDTLFRPDR